MKKYLIEEIEIPNRIEFEIDVDGNEKIITLRGKEGENKRKFRVSKVIVEKKDNKIILRSEKGTKKEKKMINTIKRHILNMLKGVQEKFEYKLKICFLHFPMKVEIKNREAIISNFLGEKIPRKVKILEGVEVKLDKGIITVKSSDKELAGQTAANFEKATRISMRDRRVFQDGIFMITKAGKEI